MLEDAASPLRTMPFGFAANATELSRDASHEVLAGRSEDCGGRDAYRRGAEAAKEATPGERRGSFDHQGLHTVTRTRIGPPFSCVVPLAANLRRTSRMRGGRGSLDAEFSA